LFITERLLVRHFIKNISILNLSKRENLLLKLRHIGRLIYVKGVFRWILLVSMKEREKK